MSVIVGIDPGLSGALAALDGDDLREVVDMPVVDKTVIPALVADWLRLHSPDVVIVEQVASMPRQGVSSTFRFGMAYGVVLGVTATIGYRVEHIRPHLWKKTMGLTADKNRSRRMACDRWPLHADLFARVKDDGRAEAALLAAWWTDWSRRPA
ncbi:hypothetical protein BH24ACT5_BH24ACT5_17340 [soil metagenome]